MGRRWTTTLGAIVLLFAQGAQAEPEASSEDLRYEVQSGDTLSDLAKRRGASVADLVEWNDGLDPDRIFAGQKLWLSEPVSLEEHVVAAGETLTAIARLHQVTLAELRTWNPQLSPNRIRAGQSLKVASRRPKSLSVSVGLPHAGSLRNPVRLPRHSAWVVRDLGRAFGTEEVVRNLREGIEALQQKHPGSPRIEIHDISLAQGGPMTDHESHQSGRDVDLALVARHCPNARCAFLPLRAGQLDAERQWTLLYHWLRREQVEAILLDYRLQAPLYREAKRRGATQKELLRWFQYPRGMRDPGGTIRHQAKHDDHVHVRFACHRTDRECEPVRVLADEARVARAAALHKDRARPF